MKAHLWDRLFDQYVMLPMQKVVGDPLRADGEHDPRGVAEAISTLRMAYEMIESKLSDRIWIAGKEFTIAARLHRPSSMHKSWSPSHLATSVWRLTSSAC